MGILSSALGLIGDVTGIGSVGDAAKTILGAIKGNPELEGKIRELELEQLKIEMAENKSVRELMIVETQSEDKFVSRARPAMLWLVFAILSLSYVILPLFNAFSLVLGGPNIAMVFPELPATVAGLFATLFGVYTGARSWDKRTKANSR